MEKGKEKAKINLSIFVFCPTINLELRNLDKIVLLKRENKKNA